MSASHTAIAPRTAAIAKRAILSFRSGQLSAKNANAAPARSITKAASRMVAARRAVASMSHSAIPHEIVSERAHRRGGRHPARAQRRENSAREAHDRGEEHALHEQRR